VRGKTPEGQNPKSVTRLKMVGRQWREEVAERSNKPEGDTVAGNLGSAGEIPTRKRSRGAEVGNHSSRGSPMLDALKGRENPMRAAPSKMGAGMSSRDREGGLNPRRGTLEESHPRARAAGRNTGEATRFSDRQGHTGSE